MAAARLHAPHCPATPHLAPPRAADAFVADALRLPYRPGCADGVLCIAVLHHLSSPARRVRLLRQLLRVLRPGGGRGIVTVWATEQVRPALGCRRAGMRARMRARMGARMRARVAEACVW